ncbi:MAG: class I SAM-dependent methyltransferase [Oscillospiraceae bacterium]|nr:class I SAM-dependent methyltransferase [Oscillospiraceae bacterium]
MSQQLLYSVIAKFYDLVDIIYFSKWETSPRKAVSDRINKNERILDLCTGTGTNAVNIAKQFPMTKIVGVDLSKAMLSIAKNKADKENADNTRFYRMDATQLRFRNETFDKILLSLVLHETEDELSAAILSEAKRVLKNDGELIVTEWEKSSSPLKRLLFLPVELLEPKSYKKFIKADMHSYFAAYGFEIKEYIHCDYSKVIILKNQTS